MNNSGVRYTFALHSIFILLNHKRAPALSIISFIYGTTHFHVLIDIFLMFKYYRSTFMCPLVHNSRTAIDILFLLIVLTKLFM